MKKLVLIACVLIGLSAKAQFFQHIYGTANPDLLTSGVNVIFNPNGHFLVGEGETCIPGVYAIPTAYTDVFGTPNFQNNYVLMNNSGVFLTPEDAQGFEMDNGAGFGIVGKYTDPSITGPTNTGVYFLHVDPAGNIVAVYNYPPVAGTFTYNVDAVGGIGESPFAGGNEIYVTGTVLTTTSRYMPFAMKINITNGNLIWSHVYDIQPPADDAWGHDIAESPDAIPGWATFVGRLYNTTSPGSYDGYVQHVDINTGVPVHPCIFYGTDFSDEHWNSINPCPPPPPGPYPPGYILGGATNINGDWDYWILRMDPLIAHFFSKSFDYSTASGTDDECFDAIERLNTSNNLEYYATGTVSTGLLGGSDAVTIKTDQFGAAIAAGEFTYGSTSNDYGKSLDQFNNTGWNGLSTYGTWGGAGLGGPNDMLHVKSYFNGFIPSSCIYSINSNADVNEIGPGLHIPSIEVDNFSMGTIIASPTPLADAQLCYSLTVTGGSNARVANPEKGDKEGSKQEVSTLVLSPNPTEKENPSVRLKFDSQLAGNAEVIIYDALGKAYYTNNFILTKGVNYLPIDISVSNLSAGVYNVVVKNSETTQTIHLMIK